MHAHSIFMLTPYVSHVCCAHREGGGGRGALAQAREEIESRGRRVNGFAGAAGRRRDVRIGAEFRRFERNGSDNTRSNVTADDPNPRLVRLRPRPER